ncbi:hypothetical protein RRG08_004786 [Elysia crispata]|uniref:Uncharacterized protein n=1 Tax=Elysia crispata TaxID=231223 RepID=A0AAE1DZ92_9GAST|nr:hypothetical protein RRG08_004786 [Elysia crispata]
MFVHMDSKIFAFVLFSMSIILCEIHSDTEFRNNRTQEYSINPESIQEVNSKILPPGLQDCLPYLLCSQDAITVLREASALISRLDLSVLLTLGKLDDLCHNVKVMKDCEKEHWKEACDDEIGSKGRKSGTKFMEWICNKRDRLERYADCWAHPGFSKRLTDCVTQYTDVSDITNCFEKELEVEEECPDGAIAFLQTMAVKYMKPS